jgi:hypothetical protein
MVVSAIVGIISWWRNIEKGDLKTRVRNTEQIGRGL